MTTILFDRTKHAYDAENFVFTMSEKDIPFATEYKVVNPKTGGSMEFTFSHSTGPEFDPKTRWVYKSPDKTVTLEVCNDPKITEAAAAAYLTAKLRN